jgi:hypothetical protein
MAAAEKETRVFLYAEQKCFREQARVAREAEKHALEEAERRAAEAALAAGVSSYLPRMPACVSERSNSAVKSERRRVTAWSAAEWCLSMRQFQVCS